MKRLLPAIAVAALAACTAPGTPAPNASVTVQLVDKAGSGFSQKLDVGLDLDHAASATPAATAPTKSTLREQGYSGGEERVFTKGDEYVTVLEFDLSTQVGAAAFVSFETAQLNSSLGAKVYAYDQIPGAQAFDLAGETRAGKKDAFCQGIWFPAGSAAFEVADCASSPRYPDLAMAVAQSQYKEASS